MLTGDEVKRLNLVEGDDANSYRAASYDIRVGVVLKPDGSKSSSYPIPPQGIAEVISLEKVQIPPGIAGFAVVKTSLCNEGILPLNIGIIDPGYHGHLSSFLVNFGKNERTIRTGEVFLRLTFQSLDKTSPVKTTGQSTEVYVAEKIKNIKERFGSDFLNLSAATTEIAKKVVNDYGLRILGYVAGAGFVLAFLTFVLNFGNLEVQRYLQPNDTVRAEVLKSELEKQRNSLESQNSLLTDTVRQLEIDLNSKNNLVDSLSSRIQMLENKA
jgi:deoxycytidine triphosphate deaminase